MRKRSISPLPPTASKTHRPPTSGSDPESLRLLIRSLKQQNNSLVEQINILKSKNKKVNQLQEKTQLIIKQNDEFILENQRLNKRINKKKREVEVWKNKYESLTVTKTEPSSLENKKLLNQIEKLKEQITDIDHMKDMQLIELNNQNNLEIQNLKRQHLNNKKKYELEIRKLKEYCEKKENQIRDINMKLVDFHQEIEILKKHHLEQVDVLDYENNKLKEVIKSKYQEIQQILAKTIKLNVNSEDQIELLKKENRELKNKIFETEMDAQIERSNLRKKLKEINDSQVLLLKNVHNNQLKLLNNEILEILKLQQIIENITVEFKTLAKEKNKIKQAFQTEIVRVKTELYNQNQDQAIKFQNDLHLCDLDLISKTEEMKAMETYLQNQISTLKKQNSKLAELLDIKTASLQKQAQGHYVKKRASSDNVQTMQNKVVYARDNPQRQARITGFLNLKPSLQACQKIQYTQ